MLNRRVPCKTPGNSQLWSMRNTLKGMSVSGGTLTTREVQRPWSQRRSMPYCGSQWPSEQPRHAAPPTMRSRMGPTARCRPTGSEGRSRPSSAPASTTKRRPALGAGSAGSAGPPSGAAEAGALVDEHDGTSGLSQFSSHHDQLSCPEASQLSCHQELSWPESSHHAAFCSVGSWGLPSCASQHFSPKQQCPAWKNRQGRCSTMCAGLVDANIRSGLTNAAAKGSCFPSGSTCGNFGNFREAEDPADTAFPERS
mmetsp:Transcript_124802/g.399944  ORF Transcript_124802/g.399944 Transcript_124802/m.399944 type:complete len:254 (-) Transcript_124802:115-876(-)